MGDGIGRTGHFDHRDLPFEPSMPCISRLLAAAEALGIPVTAL
jgi:hypothetical protein